MMTAYTLFIALAQVASGSPQAYLELTQAAGNICLNTQVSGYLGGAQVARLKAEGRAFSSRLEEERRFRFRDAVMAIRQAIGDANAPCGCYPPSSDA
ncbi:MAG: hypothetical protein IPG34_07000 [Rhodocyclaceae bacterium]|nr:hypothetical protein [Rhodocyclaceae bacterium]